MDGDRPDEQLYKIINDNDIILLRTEKTNLEKLKCLVLKREEHTDMTLTVYLQNHRFEVVTGNGKHYFVATLLNEDEMLFETEEKPEEVSWIKKCIQYLNDISTIVNILGMIETGIIVIMKFKK